MKCKYKFRLHGKLKPETLTPITVRGWTYEFDVNKDGIATHISVTVGAIKKEHWPTMKKSTTPGVSANINIPDIAFPFVKRELRVIEGLLSLYGVKKIDLKNFDTEWTSETEEEKNTLSINSFKTSYSEIPDSERQTVEFDLIARSIIGSNLGYDYEVAMSFFRKGRNDIDDQRYIEGIYNYFFMFESLYADGQFKKKKVTSAFLASVEFISAIQKVMSNPNEIIMGEKTLMPKFIEHYQGKSNREIVSRIIELRGFLHHHTAKRQDIWHPEEHEAHELDALVFQRIAFELALNLSATCVFDTKVTSAYQSMLNEVGK